MTSCLISLVGHILQFFVLLFFAPLLDKFNRCSCCVDVVDVVVGRLEVKGSDGLLHFALEHLWAAQADSHHLPVQGGSFYLQSSLESSNDGGLIAVGVSLETLHPEEDSVAPVRPLKGKRDEASR